MNVIQTHYNGYHFRSRLEARWAVYFDAVGITWDYEPEGFNLGGVPYLPDFWLPQVRMWAEVKPVGLKPDEWEKCQRLANESLRPVLMLIGTPDLRSYWAIGSNFDGYDDLCDYVLDTSCMSEARFFASTGVSYPEFCDLCGYVGDYEIARAVMAARSARFEHGESPRYVGASNA